MIRSSVSQSARCPSLRLPIDRSSSLPLSKSVQFSAIDDLQNGFRVSVSPGFSVSCKTTDKQNVPL